VVDTIRIAIRLTDTDADKVRHFTRTIDGQAGFKSYRIKVENTARINNISLQQRGHEWHVVIDCSVPVHLFGNNVAEVSDSDVGIFCSSISKYLNTALGLNLSPNEITTAEVRKVHYGKNIILPDATSLLAILNYCDKTDVRLNRSVSSVKYQEGKSFHIRTKSYDLTLYDKSAENMTKSLTSQHYLSASHSILRIELRLNNRRIVTRFCPNEPKTVSGLLKNDVAQRVIISALDLILQPQHYGDDTFRAMTAASVDTTNPGNFLSSIGLNMLIKESGVAATKHLLNQKFGNHVWPRYKRWARKAALPDAVASVMSEIEEWKIIPP
jgi:hypothetical protein